MKLVAGISQRNTAGSSAKSCHWQFLPDAAKVQQWKFPSFENTNFRALLNQRFGRTICEGGHFTCVEA